MTNIVLNSKTYTSNGFNQNGMSAFGERSAGTPAGFSYLTTKVTTATGDNNSSVKWNLSLPVLVPADSACGCAGDLARTYFVKFDVVVPAGSSAAERADVLARIQDLVLDPTFVASINNLVQAV